MKRSILLAAIASSSILINTGCETTGDPTQGGLFGWSETKAKVRQDELRDVLYLEQDRRDSAQASSSRLRRTRSANAAALADERRELARLRSQLDEVDAAGGRGRTASVRARIDRAASNDNAEEAQLRSNVNSIRGEVQGLRKEYGLLMEQR
jgi:hypothetical protein